MQVKMLTAAAGPDGVQHVGDVVDVPSAEARALIAGGYAEHVAADRDRDRDREGPRTATAPAPDDASTRSKPKPSKPRNSPRNRSSASSRKGKGSHPSGDDTDDGDV